MNIISVRFLHARTERFQKAYYFTNPTGFTLKKDDFVVVLNKFDQPEIVIVINPDITSERQCTKSIIGIYPPRLTNPSPLLTANTLPNI